MKILWIVLIVLVTIAAVELILLYSGAYNVAASAPHTTFVGWALNTMQARSVAVRARDIEATPLDSAMSARGAGLYAEMCELCHGGPGVERSEIGRGITPRPPDLAEVGPAWSDEQLFWILENGIKLAGMPAFGATHEDEELWRIVAFVRRLPELTPEKYRSQTAAAQRQQPHQH